MNLTDSINISNFWLNNTTSINKFWFNEIITGWVDFDFLIDESWNFLVDENDDNLIL